MINEDGMRFLTAARKVAEPLACYFVDRTETLKADLLRAGMSTEKALKLYRALKQSGHIRPTGAWEFDSFEITPFGFRELLIQQYGSGGYRNRVSEVHRVYREFLLKGGGAIEKLAVTLNMSLLSVQEILYADAPTKRR